ncbi:MAG: AarF/ABC1/UbiB kinase family protein [Chloroflexota bacterium]|nr:MAG: AarF/ABC1/UbiB kinase family protein [Chloroflexota bacterium]
MLIRPRYLRRYRQIVEILADYGFGAFLAQMGMSERLNIPRWWRRRKEIPGDEMTNPRRLRRALEDLGPTFIKFGQILSTRSDILPPQYIEELSYLQDEVPPVTWEEARQVVETELGAPVEELFAEVDPVPIASASLAQVHVACLVSGEEVVVKIQRPNIERTINLDLDIIYDLARTAQQRIATASRYEIADIAEEFSAGLRSEMDFRREAWNADRFRQNFADEAHLYVPKIYWEYSTRRLLVMERIQGIKIDDLDALEAAGYSRQRLSGYAADFALKEVLIDGFFHADPHPGNMLILPGEVIGVLDFGTVGRLDDSDRANLARLFIAGVQLDVDGIVDQLQRMGVADYRVDRMGLQRDMKRILTRYYGLPIYEIDAQEVAKAVQPIMYEYKLNVPTNYYLLMKTVIMMQGVGLKLDPDFDIIQAAQPYIGKLFRRMWLPTSWGPGAIRLAMDWRDFVSVLPRTTTRILDQVERGQLTVQAELPQLEPTINAIDRLINRVIFSVLVAALVVALALLLPRLDYAWPWGLLTWIIVVGFFVLVFLAIRLAWSVFRSGRAKFNR